jgi:putative porin
MRKLLTCVIAGCVLLSWPATADEASVQQQIEQLLEIQKQQAAQIQKLQAQLTEMQEKQGEFAEELPAVKESLEEAKSKSSWTDRIKVHGDLRYRHEWIDREGRKDHTRHRVRGRVGVTAQLTDTVDVGFQIASGSDDPVSTNQTLDMGFSSKDVWIDLAYFDWHPEQVDGLHIVGGKMKNPFYRPGKTELVWDGDLRPEGLALKYSGDFGNAKPFASLGGFWVDERSNDSDSYILGAQAGLKYKLSDTLSLTGGVSIYNYDDIQNRAPFYDASDSFGNSIRLADFRNAGSPILYAEDFTEVEVFGELNAKVAGLPVSVFGDYVQNVDADDDDTGWLAGFKIGRCKEPGSFEFSYNYRELERDAVVGAFTSSDFGGGGTDGKGHTFGAGYQVSKRIALGASYFLNDVGLEGHSDDYERLQLDAKFKF